MADGTKPTHTTSACLCGAVRATSTSAALKHIVCHCLDCQKSSGTAFEANVWFRASAVTLDLRLPQGQTKQLRFATAPVDIPDLPADGPLRRFVDARVHRWFCAVCGTYMFLTIPRLEDFVTIMSGTVERMGVEKGDGGVEWEDVRGTPWFKPEVQFFCRRRLGYLGGMQGVGVEYEESSSSRKV